MTKSESAMAQETDVVKGRFKEVAGALTCNDELRAEGQANQAVGEVKQVADRALDKFNQSVEKLRD